MPPTRNGVSLSLGWSTKRGVSGYCPLTQRYTPPPPFCPQKRKLPIVLFGGDLYTKTLSSRSDNKDLLINQPESRVSKIPMGTRRSRRGWDWVPMNAWYGLGCAWILYLQDGNKLRARLYWKSRTWLWFSLRLFHSFRIDIVHLPHGV